MYSLSYRFKDVVHECYFDCGSYADAVVAVAKMRASESEGVVLEDSTRYINVNNQRHPLFYIRFGEVFFRVHAVDLTEAQARAHALQRSTHPVIRNNSSFL